MKREGGTTDSARFLDVHATAPTRKRWEGVRRRGVGMATVITLDPSRSYSPWIPHKALPLPVPMAVNTLQPSGTLTRIPAYLPR